MVVSNRVFSRDINLVAPTPNHHAEIMDFNNHPDLKPQPNFTTLILFFIVRISRILWIVVFYQYLLALLELHKIPAKLPESGVGVFY